MYSNGYTAFFNNNNKNLSKLLLEKSFVLGNLSTKVFIGLYDLILHSLQ